MDKELEKNLENIIVARLFYKKMEIMKNIQQKIDL